jgi:hypothetical protein
MTAVLERAPEKSPANIPGNIPAAAERIRELCERVMLARGEMPASVLASDVLDVLDGLDPAVQS